jgi:hypothetical protein
MTSSSSPAASGRARRDLHLRHVLGAGTRLRSARSLDARHDVEALAAAIALAQQRLADRQRIERRDEGAHRQRSTGGVAISDSSRTPVSASCSVRGIGVADSVSTCTSAFSSFSRSLCLTPKCCSSSTISRPRSANLMPCPAAHGCRRRCRPCRRRALLGLGQLLGADQPRGLAHADRQAGEALGEGLEVLARQQRRRHDDGDLLAAHRRDEGGAQRHLGLAEADIAADQPVHRPAGAEIVETASMAVCWSSVSS